MENVAYDYLPSTIAIEWLNQVVRQSQNIIEDRKCNIWLSPQHHSYRVTESSSPTVSKYNSRWKMYYMDISPTPYWIKRNMCLFMKYKYRKTLTCGIFAASKFCDITRGDQKVRGKVLLYHSAFIDCNENSQIETTIHSKLTEIEI